MADWVFQANPKHYDIVAALSHLNEIAWRVPQYTGDIRSGDGVFIWRSGKEAGIVGIGTVVGSPALRPVPARELPFAVEGAGEQSAETRAVIRVQAVGPIDKAQIADHPTMSDHQIITAPMGTVFPLDDEQGRVLRSLVKTPFPTAPLVGIDEPRWPAVYSWKDRRKDVYPVPGGSDGQVATLLQLLAIVAERRPTLDEFAASIQTSFGSSASNARHNALFLRRIGFVDEVAGLLEPSAVGKALLNEQDDALVVAHLHQRARFVGEMLAAVAEPKTDTEILEVANRVFGMGWTTKAQIQRRRGWLQSAGSVERDDEGSVVLTQAGRALLARLELHTPDSTVEATAQEEESTPSEPPKPRETKSPTLEHSEVTALVAELAESSIDSGNSDRFEHAIAEAFSFLGFRAVQLGGAGKTDVVADADLGRDDSYRVIIDGKTTGRGAVDDHQIDWDTIDEHRLQHEADYVVIAAPAFRGERLVTRATGHQATLMTANDLAELVSQHAETPLDLDAYRQLFTSGDGGDGYLESLTETVEESQRFVEIALAVLEQVEEHVSDVGSLSARDLHLLLRHIGELDASEPEIQEALDALASPLVGALAQTDRGYRPTSQRSNSVRRLRLLANVLEA